jgi:large subunit ribosomal protein L21
VADTGALFYFSVEVSLMYAIIRTGGKQYKVQAGDVVRIEKLNKDLGEEIELTEVLAMGGEGQSNFGAPVVDGAKVTAVVTNQSKLPKVIVFKKKRRQGYRRLKGHRQLYSEIFIKEISGPAGSVKADASAPVFDPSKREARLKAKEEAKKEAKKAGVAKPAAKKATKAKKKSTSKKKTVKKKATAKKATAKKKATKKKSASTVKKKSAKKATTKKKTATKKKT